MMNFRSLLSVFAAHVLLLCCASAASAADPVAPTLTKITIASTSTSHNLVTESVMLTGSGFADGMTLGFSPDVISPSNLTVQSDGSAKATFTFPVDASSPISVTVTVGNLTSAALDFETGTATECLDALQSGSCRVRLTVMGTAARGTSTADSGNTKPNFLAILDIQAISPKSPDAVKARKIAALQAHNENTRQEAAKPASQGLLGRAVAHITFTTGFTQAPAASNVVSTNTNGTTISGTTPSARAAAASNTTPMITQQQAFVGDLKGTLGLSLWRQGQGGNSVFGVLGVAARASAQALLSPDQIVQSGGLTYVSLSGNNPNQVTGFWEATGHFHLGQYGHNTGPTNSGTYANVSHLLVLEAGFQNNSGLAQLVAGNPETNTRQRWVGRFYLTPEIPGTNAKHTTLTLGMEYSRGVNGGPKVVQIFVGTNVNPAKLFGKTT